MKVSPGSVRAAIMCLALVLAACANPPTAQQPSASTVLPTASPRMSVASATTTPPTLLPPTAAPAPAATAVPPDVVDTSASLSPAQPDGLPTASVIRVIDGDTVDVRLEGQVIRLRLIGINTPEAVDPRRPVECYGREASAKAHELLDGQTVAVEADASQGDRDRYGRLLRYLWLEDGRLFNQEMVAEGYAFEYTYSAPYKYQAAFKQAEQDAREAQRGLWSPEACAGKHRPAEATRR